MLAACTQPGARPNAGVMQGGAPNKQDFGTIIGGVAGGVLGHQIGGGSGRTIATIGGTLLGAALGNSVGASLDRADMQYYNQTSQQAMETGQPGQSFPWQNPQSGNSGVIIPSNYYQSNNGQYCREYTQRITVGGHTQEGYGTACRQPDGSWQVTQ
jgi:surface antigen